MANRLRFAIVAGLVGLSACTVHQTTAPSAATVGGTTDFSLSLDMTATPDSISQDGASQSSIVVTAHGTNGAPKSGVPVRLDMQVDGVTQDFGVLNARNVVTGSDGRASAIYTAPPTSPMAGGSGTMISIVASPSGTDAQATNTRSVSIRLVPPGVILPPAGSPTAAFTFSPLPPTVGVLLRFDASASVAGAGATRIVSYDWTFDDGVSATGVAPTHTFNVAGTHTVTLSVTNDRGMGGSTPQPIVVAASAAPQASFSFSPATIHPGDNVFFNGSSSSVPAGRTIASYDWDFGDGAPHGSGATPGPHQYLTTNTGYNVTLTVTDDLGQRAFAQNKVPVVP
jgi:PKD repeat protein